MTELMEVNKITKELRKKHKLEENIIDLTVDVAFKKVMSMESNRWYLAFIISYCTKLDIDYILKNLEFKNDLIAGKNLKKKTGNGDLVVKVENKIINLEMNRKVTEELIRKNKWYIDTLNSTSVKKNTILKDRFIVQINISRTRRIPQTNTLMYEIVRMDKNLLVEDVYNNEIIYDINLEYLEEELYNKGKLNKEEKRLLLFIERNKKKLNKMFEGDLKMKDTLNNLDEVGEFDDISFALEYDKELLDERIQAELVEKAEEKGKKETAIEIAKKLLKSNVSIENINKITELPIEEIEKIQEDKEFGDISFALEYDKEALDEQINKEWMEQEIKEGIEKGIEEGVKNASINIAKEMIKEGLSLEQISRITKILIDELKNI